MEVLANTGCIRKFWPIVFCVICGICISGLTSSCKQHMKSSHQKTLGELLFCKDGMRIASKESRGINLIILAFRMVHDKPIRLNFLLLKNKYISGCLVRHLPKGNGATTYSLQNTCDTPLEDISGSVHIPNQNPFCGHPCLSCMLCCS